MDVLSTKEFIGVNLFCILKHILYIRKYLAYFLYFRIYSKIIFKKPFKLLFSWVKIATFFNSNNDYQFSNVNF